MRIYDLSPRLSDKTGVFPGDVRFRRDTAMSFEAGHHLALSAVTTTLHIGSHADSPGHYVRRGSGIDRRALGLYVGQCWVANASAGRGEQVAKMHLSATAITAVERRHVSRILFRTGTFPDPENWNSDFASLCPQLIHWLADHGVVLVGIDTPSVDPETSKTLEAHAALAARDLAVLEGICLSGVPEGRYFLSAAPLKIVDGDAGPLRAFLVEGLEGDVAPNVPVIVCERGGE
ncbi:MAG: cyclase family protein [Bdellovibrionaceae bacterium]|nr:cyclase family protein [Pseudobdellovibrionaceae bacterium]